MSKHRRQGGRVTPKGTRPPAKSIGGYRERPSREPSFVHDAHRRMLERSPFGLLALASSIVEATSVRPLDLLRQDGTEHVTGPELYDSFIESELPETEALVRAVATLLPDAALAQTLLQRIETRGSVIRNPPAWLDTMDHIEFTDVAELVHILGDGDNVMVAWRWPDRSAATAVVYIDHNMGTIVKDAFIMPESFDVLVRQFERSGLMDQVIRPLDPAVARTRITEAIEAGERVLPPLETDSWPMCRPLVEWVVRSLPDGGLGYVRPDWTDDDRRDLFEDFIISPFARALGLRSAVMHELGEPLVWFGCDYGPGDPLRWSAVSVEIVLVDWYPRKIFSVDRGDLFHLPAVLEAFVRFAHDRREIPTYLTDETVEAVARWTPDFLEAMARPGRSPMSNAVHMARIAAGLDPDSFDGDDDDWDDDEIPVALGLDHARLDEIESHVIEQAGGPEAYAALSDDPLPDEPFDWSAVPDQWRSETASALVALDRLTTELSDVETRTIGRRILATLVSGDTDLFKRSADFDRLAAAIIWVMFREWPRYWTSPAFKFRTQKELSAATGVKATAIGSRASAVDGMLRLRRFDWTRSLHSARRRDLLETQAMIADWRRGVIR